MHRCDECDIRRAPEDRRAGLEERLQHAEPAVAGSLLVITGGGVQVGAALEAQATAVCAANRVDWNFEQHVLSHQGGEVDMPVIRYNKAGICNRTAIKGKQFRKIHLQGLFEIFETASTTAAGVRVEFDLDEQALGRAGDTCTARKISEGQFLIEPDLRKVKIKVAAVAYCLVDNKANVQPQKGLRM